MANPTTQSYTSLRDAYDYLNTRLFSGSLPPCLITIQRHAKAYGYFSGGRFARASDPRDITDEIALNPAHFGIRKSEEVLSTLAHEMTHLWQHHFGDRPRPGYHNRQWAKKMREIGLIPTATGKIGGHETGQKVSHVIDPVGAYARAVETFLREHPAILYHDRLAGDEKTRRKKAASKTKYTCPDCGLNAWAKPAAALICGTCEEEMDSVR
jgi:hypothetical protein